MATSKYSKKENKNTKALFSIVCLCIISLGLVVYFSTMQKSKDNTVNQNTTIVETSAVMNAVTKEEKPATTKAETTKEQAKPKSTTKKQAQTMTKTKTNTPYKSYYKYPLTDAVLKGYSEELTLDETLNDYRVHTAVDFKGAKGDTVVAINDGLVLDVYTDDMYGMCVKIDHGGKLVAYYCGLESANVKKGEYVDIGNQIGTLGSIPCESKAQPHLHFETELKNEAVNPLDVMSKTE